jgi:hypothetical protein
MSITSETPGTFAVVTESGAIYILNPQERWVQRQSSSPDTQLRKDGTHIPLISLVGCKVGEPLFMFLDILRDGITVTKRVSTPVILIEKLDDAEATARWSRS